MVSYAQNAEDVVLRRVFADLQQGFYVDVGAGDPVEHSVTKLFYDRGWTGINVEPGPSFSRLETERPRDVNLRTAVAHAEEVREFWVSTPHPGLSTLYRPTSPQLLPDGFSFASERVKCVPMSRILDEHGGGRPIDFMKIDVEGAEGDVISSIDFESTRPKVVVVEALAPLTLEPNHEDWEATLLSAAYRFGLFDGLNRFYCRDEDADLLLALLSAPANVLDNWRPAREVQTQEALQAKVVTIEAEYASTRSVLAAEQSAHAHTRTVLADMHDSTSWRITAPLRDASRLAKLMRRGAPR